MKMTVSELSKHYNVTGMTIRSWIRDGKIPYEIEKVVGIRPRMKINLEKVEFYLKSKESKK